MNDDVYYKNSIIRKYLKSFYIKLFNVQGQKVKSLVNGIKAAGNHTALWNGKDTAEKSVSSEIYYYE